MRSCTTHNHIYYIYRKLCNFCHIIVLVVYNYESAFTREIFLQRKMNLKYFMDDWNVRKNSHRKVFLT